MHILLWGSQTPSMCASFLAMRDPKGLHTCQAAKHQNYVHDIKQWESPCKPSALRAHFRLDSNVHPHTYPFQTPSKSRHPRLHIVGTYTPYMGHIKRTRWAYSGGIAATQTSLNLGYPNYPTSR